MDLKENKMKILNWNCEGGFFTKGKYKLVEKYDADIMIIQECSNPDKSIDKKVTKLYQNYCWLPDYKQEEVLIEGRTVKDVGVAVFSKDGILLNGLPWKTECDEEITWWKVDKKTETPTQKAGTPIIKNKRLRGFNPVYIEYLDLLLLGVHTKTGVTPKKYDGMGQMWAYLNNIVSELNNYKNVIIAGDLNAGFKECDREKYKKLIKTYDESSNLKESVRNYSDEFIPTHYESSGIGYINDFIFLSKFLNINVEPTGEWKANKKDKKKWGYVDEENKGSDHCPLILEIEI
jgi:exonuclease III